MTNQQFCLKWNNHTSNMLSIFQDLKEMNIFVDVTLACEGLSLKAHKLVLSACSDFFRSLFIDNPCQHPVVIMKDVAYRDLKAIVDFMYHGEVSVSQDQFSTLLKTAEMLRVKGLAEVDSENNINQALNIDTPPADLPVRIVGLQSCAVSQKKASSPPGQHRKPRARKQSFSKSKDNEIVLTQVKEPNSPNSEEIPVEPIKNSHSHTFPMSSETSHSFVNICSSSVMSHPSVVQEDHPSEGDSECEVQPYKLLEQTLTSPNISSVSALPISGLSSDMSLVPTNDNSQFHELNIKKEISIEDFVPSSYTDQSSHPGPSGMQDNTAIAPQISQFREEIIGKLIPYEQISPFDGRKRTPGHTIQKILKKNKRGETARRRCRQCSKHKKAVYSIYYCPGCAEDPALCATCFDNYHA